MVEQALEETRVALRRHALMRCGREVAVIVAHEHGDAPGDGRVNLVGRLAPLLHGVVEEDVLVDVVCHLGELGIVLLTQLHDGHLLVLAEGGHELLIETLALLVAKRELERGVVERNRHELALDVGKHLVLIVGPLGEAGQELVHAVIGGVVDVRAVLVNEDASVIEAVVSVSRDVRTTLQDGHLIATRLGQTAGAGGTGVSGTHDEDVVRSGVEVLRKAARDAHCVPLGLAGIGSTRQQAICWLVL